MLTASDNDCKAFVFTVSNADLADRENTWAKGKRFQAVAGRPVPNVVRYMHAQCRVGKRGRASRKDCHERPLRERSNPTVSLTQ